MAFSAFGDRRVQAAPIASLLDYLENQMDQNMGRILRNIPVLLSAAGGQEDYVSVSSSKKRKLQSVAAKPQKGKIKTIAESVQKNGIYTITLDCPQYDPDEITVRVISGKIHVNAKHESEADDSYENFEIVKTFDMPRGALAEHVTSRLSATGQLTIEVSTNRTDSMLGMLIPLQVDQPSTSDIATETSLETSNADTQTSTEKN